MVASLLAESVGQSRESAKGHSRGQVEPLHAARSDFVFRNVAADHRFGDACYGPRRVPHLSRVPASVLEALHDLSVIAVVVERGGDGAGIAGESIRVDYTCRSLPI